MKTVNLQVTYLRLHEAAICADCSTIFKLGTPACPTCTSRTFALLATWLKARE